MYFLSALYTLQYVLIVKMTLVIFIQKQKKQKKMTRTSVWVKNTKVMPQKTPLSIFFLGKGRESLCLQTLHKKLSKSALSALPQARKSF